MYTLEQSAHSRSKSPKVKGKQNLWIFHGKAHVIKRFSFALASRDCRGAADFEITCATLQKFVAANCSFAEGKWRLGGHRVMQHYSHYCRLWILLRRQNKAIAHDPAQELLSSLLLQPVSEWVREHRQVCPWVGAVHIREGDVTRLHSWCTSHGQQRSRRTEGACCN